jgi:hypothetical protein
MAKITVFGGSLTNPGDLLYEEAYQLGKMLGNEKYTILTGGYVGTMEAVSRGGADSGAHVIGVTCQDIEAWRPVKPNAWVAEEYRTITLNQRIQILIESCDAALALPGGVGTLTEISVMWNLLLTSAISPRPLIIIGSGWHSVFDRLIHEQEAYIPENQRQWLHFSPNVNSAFLRLQELLSDGKVYA